MISRTAVEFWALYNELPEEIQALAKKNFVLFNADPTHPSLRFKNIRGNIWTARVGDHYRALARKKGDVWFWAWIGPHERYNKLLRQLR